MGFAVEMRDGAILGMSEWTCEGSSYQLTYAPMYSLPILRKDGKCVRWASRLFRAASKHLAETLSPGLEPALYSRVWRERKMTSTGLKTRCRISGAYAPSVGTCAMSVVY